MSETRSLVRYSACGRWRSTWFAMIRHRDLAATSIMQHVILRSVTLGECILAIVGRHASVDFEHSTCARRPTEHRSKSMRSIRCRAVLARVRRSRSRVNEVRSSTWISVMQYRNPASSLPEHASNQFDEPRLPLSGSADSNHLRSTALK